MLSKIQGLRGKILGLRGQISGRFRVGGGQTDGQTDGRMDRRANKRKSPTVLQDFIPFEFAALFPLISILNHAKQGNGYVSCKKKKKLMKKFVTEL